MKKKKKITEGVVADNEWELLGLWRSINSHFAMKAPAPGAVKNNSPSSKRRDVKVSSNNFNDFDQLKRTVVMNTCKKISAK